MESSVRPSLHGAPLRHFLLEGQPIRLKLQHEDCITICGKKSSAVSDPAIEGWRAREQLELSISRRIWNTLRL